MTHLDSYALIAYLRDERAADQVERLLREGAAMAAVAVAEVVDHLVRHRGDALTRSRSSSRVW